MNTNRSRRVVLAAFCAALAALALTATGGPAPDAGIASAASSFNGAPIVTIEGGAVRGLAVDGGLSRPDQRRQPCFALGVRSAIDGHLLLAEGPDDRPR